MKVTKDAARSARQLLRLSHKDGILDHDRIKEITAKVSEAKPHGIIFYRKYMSRKDVLIYHIDDTHTYLNIV